MLKRNLIAIAIISLAIIFAGNAFGQNNKQTAGKSKTVKGTKGKVSFSVLSVRSKKKPKSNQRTSRSLKKPKRFQVDQKLGMPDY
jgi:hypothetical protein